MMILLTWLRFAMWLITRRIRRIGYRRALHFLQNQLGLEQNPQPMLMMGPPPGEGGEGAPMPMMFMNPPVVPEGSVPVTPADMPLGQADNIHMPFNAGFQDKDFTVYK